MPGTDGAVSERRPWRAPPVGPAIVTGIEAEPKLVRYLDELYRWNERINLTSIPRVEAESRHLAEARRLLVHAAPATGARVADIGAGGRRTGMVMAILRPDLRVTLIESDRRKAGFLVHAAALCDCARVTVEPRRAEEVGRDPAHRDTYDLAVSRATASAPVLCELALPLLHAGGACSRWWPTPRPTRAALHPPRPPVEAGSWPRSPPGSSPSPRLARPGALSPACGDARAPTAARGLTAGASGGRPLPARLRSRAHADAA